MLMVRVLATLVFVVALLEVSSASVRAQSSGLSDDELNKTIPGPGDDAYRGPYFRWREDTQISVVVMTDDQISSCVDRAIADIQQSAASALTTSPGIVPTTRLSPIGRPILIRHVELVCSPTTAGFRLVR